MEHEHVIHALRRKRAEISGDLGQAEARVQRLQADIAAVDTTLRLFDPNQKPATIKPRVKREKAPRFRPGEFTRTLMGLIREASEPMTVRELAEAVSRSHGLDGDPKAMRTLVANTRAALAKPREGLVRASDGGVYRWSAG